MIQLVTMLKRKPGTSHEQFLAHWHDVHGPLIRRLSTAQYVRRYEQHASIWPTAGSRMPEPAYDGVTIQWFDSAESFWKHLGEPDQAEMIEDVANFLDVDQLHWTICEQPLIVIDNQVASDQAGPPNSGS
jgi:uncharacterized protein (TIGR02118 family)